MSQTTFRPTPEDHLSRLSRQAEELRGQLKNLDGALRQSGNSVPAGLLTGLRQMSVILEELRETFSTSEVERRNLQALAEINQVINSSLDLNTVLNEVIDTIIRLTGAERAFLMLRNERGELEIKTARNWERESVGTGDVEISRTIIDRVLAQGEAILTTNATEDPRFGGQQSVVAYNLRSILCVPLKVKGHLTGVIYSDNKARAALFSPRERDLLTSFAHQAAVAIENARLFASVQATLAEVTDLKNLMEDVFASIASGVITSDIMDKITLCNRAAERILAIPANQLIGSSLADLLPKLADDLPDKVLLVKQKDQRVIDLEVRPVLAGRGSVALSLNLTPLKTAEEATRGVAMVMDDLTERRRLEAQRRLFEVMVSPAVIDQLDPDRLQLGGQLREITTLFADIRGFTSFSEEIDPVTLVSVLNEYLAGAAEAVLEEEGTIDKFQGDAIMAWFNAPIPQQDHTLRAARAALGIRQAVYQVRERMEPRFRLSFGVGIHVGDGLLGLVGTRKRLDYTAIGDSINTAKRLQENAAPDQILVSAAAEARVHGLAEVRAVPAIQAHGKKQPLEVYELLGLTAG